MAEEARQVVQLAPKRDGKEAATSPPMGSARRVLSPGHTSDATTARWYEAFRVRAVKVNPSVNPSVRVVKPLKNKASAEGGPGRSGVDVTREREIHRCSRSECARVGCDCLACCSRDVRDAGAGAVGRKHDCVRRPLNSQCPKSGLVDAATGDQRYRPPLRAFSPSGRLAQLHLQAEHRKRRASITARQRKAQGERQRSHCSANCMVSFRLICEISHGASVVRVTSQRQFLSRRLVQLHLQAEHK